MASASCALVSWAPVSWAGGGFRLGHRRGQPGQVAVKLGHEVGHVGEQGVLVPQERVRRRIRRPDDLAEGQVELGRPAGHVVEHRVQAGQPPVDLLGVLGRGRRGERLEVIEDVGENQPGQVRVPDPRAEHILHRGERAVADLAELVDRLPVPVPGQASAREASSSRCTMPSSASASSFSRRVPFSPGTSS
jgi:hypothetical protein